MDKPKKKKKTQFGEKRTEKHFVKLQNAVGENTYREIYRKKKMQF